MTDYEYQMVSGAWKLIRCPYQLTLENKLVESVPFIFSSVYRGCTSYLNQLIALETMQQLGFLDSEINLSEYDRSIIKMAFTSLSELKLIHFLEFLFVKQFYPKNMFWLLELNVFSKYSMLEPIRACRWNVNKVLEWGNFELHIPHITRLEYIELSEWYKSFLENNQILHKAELIKIDTQKSTKIFNSLMEGI